jgi:hypothetical protein
MKLEIDKSYLTKHGRFVKLTSQPWENIFNGEYENDGRGDMYGRWKEDGRRWDFLSFKGDFYIPEHDIVMEDCKEARIIAEEMKLERKKKAYEETL